MDDQCEFPLDYLSFVKDIPSDVIFKANYEMAMNKTEQARPGDDATKAGIKFDQGKLRYDLLPVEGVRAVADILGGGAAKYGDRNWEQGMDWSRPFGACLRHLFAWWAGERADPDTGRSHLWHAACNVFFLIAYEDRNKGKDDRPNQAQVG